MIQRDLEKGGKRHDCLEIANPMVVTDKSEGLFYFKGNDWRKVDSEVKKGKAGKI